MKLPNRAIVKKILMILKKMKRSGKREERFLRHSTRVLGSEVMLYMTVDVKESI